MTRTLVFVVLITSNICLTLVNRSFYYSIWTTMKYKNNLVAIIIGITVGITGLLLYITPLTRFFEFDRLPFQELLLAIGIGLVSVLWFEGVKVWRRMGSS
ncbi:MAG: cation transporting ATPase C-terminal domain-containing protein [Cytophagales bacterium]|nr:cation transporting ATPase C-terminal domain-containing protein [Cytophagales bacterium]